MSTVQASYYDPYRAFRFEVVVAGINAQVGFQKISGLKEASDVVEYREGNMYVHKRKLPGLTNYDPVTFTRGATNSQLVIGWRADVAAWGGSDKYDGVPPANSANGQSSAGSGFRREVTIALYDKGESGGGTGGVKKWKIHQAWPSELSTSDLNAEASEVLIETMVLQHEGIQILDSGAERSASGAR